MAKAERDAMNLLIHTLVDKIDEAGLGVQMIEHLGQDGFQTLMDAYREHEKTKEK